MIPHCPFLVGIFYKFVTATEKKCKRNFKNNCSGCGGGGKNRLCRLSTGALNRKESPFVHATIWETPRLTPSGPICVAKCIHHDGVVLHGVPMKQGHVISLEGYTTGTDHEWVDNPEEFRPECWFLEAVKVRKGMKNGIIDHPYLKDPFSQVVFLYNQLWTVRELQYPVVWYVGVRAVTSPTGGRRVNQPFLLGTGSWHVSKLVKILRDPIQAICHST